MEAARGIGNLDTLSAGFRILYPPFPSSLIIPDLPARYGTRTFYRGKTAPEKVRQENPLKSGVLCNHPSLRSSEVAFLKKILGAFARRLREA
jgi:hypothetical protein